MQRIAITFEANKNKNVIVENNYIQSHGTGIHSLFSTPLTGTIQNNLLETSSGTGTNILCLEDFTPTQSPGESWRIIDNAISNYDSGGRGIRIIGGSNFEIKQNEIYFGEMAPVKEGINLELSHVPELDCNIIDYQLNDQNQLSPVGLKVTASINGEYECNDISGWDNGVLFRNDNMKNLFKGNAMSNCNTGLSFTSTAIIGPQSHKGNCWDNNNQLDLSHQSSEEDRVKQSQFIIKCANDSQQNACGCEAEVAVGNGGTAVPTDLLDSEPFGNTETCEKNGVPECPNDLVPQRTENTQDDINKVANG